MANFNLLAGCCGILLLIKFEFQPVQAQRDGDLRFAGPSSTSYQGRVEVFYQGRWGTVCKDAFGTTEAQVVCRQMGFSREVIAGAQFIKQRFGPGTGPIWLDDVDCDVAPEITKLIDCHHNGWNNSNCVHEEDIGVICPQTTVTTRAPPLTTTAHANVGPNPGNGTNPYPYVRLMSPGNAPYGVVQVFNTARNEWGTLCDNTWDIRDARVVCRMMHYYHQNSFLPGAPPFDKTGITEPMTVKEVHCTGLEASVTDCRQSNWAHNSCQASRMALVTCAPLDSGASNQPVPGLVCTDARLTATFSKIVDPDLHPDDLSVVHHPGTICNAPKIDRPTYVNISIPFDECDVQRTYNATHIFYNSIIQYEQTRYTGDISYRDTFFVFVLCCLPRDLNASRPIFPEYDNVTKKAEAMFEVSMHFFYDNYFHHEILLDPVKITLGEYVHMALKLKEPGDPELVMVVHNCYATPSENRDHAVRYDLFRNKCPVDPTLSVYQINNTFVGFRWKMFRFVNFLEVHIHCEVFICAEEEASTREECDRGCYGRKKRSIEDHEVLYVEGPTIIGVDREDADEGIQDPLPPTTGQQPVTNEPTTDYTVVIPTAAPIIGNYANSLTSLTTIWCLCGLTSFMSFVV